MRRPSRARVPRRPAADRPALLHQRRGAEVRTKTIAAWQTPARCTVRIAEDLPGRARRPAATATRCWRPSAVPKCFALMFDGAALLSHPCGARRARVDGGPVKAACPVLQGADGGNRRGRRRRCSNARDAAARGSTPPTFEHICASQRSAGRGHSSGNAPAPVADDSGFPLPQVRRLRHDDEPAQLRTSVRHGGGRLPAATAPFSTPASCTPSSASSRAAAWTAPASGRLEDLKEQERQLRVAQAARQLGSDHQIWRDDLRFRGRSWPSSNICGGRIQDRGPRSEVRNPRPGTAKRRNPQNRKLLTTRISLWA